MITNPNMPEEGISELLKEYFQSGYSIQDFCFLKGNIDEARLQELIQKYCPDRSVADDDLFLNINVIKEERKAGRPKKNLQPVETGSLFARIGDIELYQYVPSEYLKSLKS